MTYPMVIAIALAVLVIFMLVVVPNTMPTLTIGGSYVEENTDNR
jgi:uncharacterized protein YoxC